jgi:hypothetical protein
VCGSNAETFEALLEASYSGSKADPTSSIWEAEVPAPEGEAPGTVVGDETGPLAPDE